MKILWCQEHAQAEDGEGLCHRGRSAFERYRLAGCRMVPMRLIPDNIKNLYYEIDDDAPEST